MKLRFASIVFGVVCLASLALAADWPQWRGPQRSGLSTETGLLKKWPQGGPQLLWQLKNLGQGYSTPAIAGDLLFAMGNQGNDNEFVQAIDLREQREIWQTKIGKVGPNTGPQYPGARSTPTIDGNFIYAVGSDGDLACLEAASGAIRWAKNMRTDFGGKPGAWAYAESPLVDGELVVCSPGGKDATLVALNKTSGEVVWKAAVPENDEAGYASIVISEVGGIKQYVQFMAKGVIGVDAKTGKFLWRYNRTAQGSSANMPTPIASGNFVYTSTTRTGGGLVELKAEQGAVEATQVYFTAKLPTAIGGAVLVGNYLYGTNSAGLMCADFATGETKWQDRCVGPGSVCYADGRLYVHGEKGDVALVEATADEYREVGRFTPPDQPDHAANRSQAWCYPVVANGKLYIRDMNCLWCYSVTDASGN